MKTTNKLIITIFTCIIYSPLLGIQPIATLWNYFFPPKPHYQIIYSLKQQLAVTTKLYDQVLTIINKIDTPSIPQQCIHTHMQELTNIIQEIINAEKQKIEAEYPDIAHYDPIFERDEYEKELEKRLYYYVHYPISMYHSIIERDLSILTKTINTIKKYEKQLAIDLHNKQIELDEFNHFKYQYQCLNDEARNLTSKLMHLKLHITLSPLYLKEKIVHTSGTSIFATILAGIALITSARALMT